jgi:uncharacterized protein (TIGR00730 family)
LAELGSPGVFRIGGVSRASPAYHERMLTRVCVFCGSNSGRRPSYLETARSLGRLLAARGVGLVYGGGNVGLMGALADAVLDGGGEAIGVIPGHLVDKELAHRGLTDLRIVHSMHERKALMADLADAFIALPGGLGTLEEFCEVLTWSQLGLHRKPCALFNVENYYDGLLALFDHAVGEGFVSPDHRQFLLVDDDGARLLDRLSSCLLPVLDRWVDRETR